MVTKSDALTPDRNDWLVPTPLKRGEIYAWTVTAVVDGKEITSPGPSAPEMKFQVLSAANLPAIESAKANPLTSCSSGLLGKSRNVKGSRT